MSGRIFETAFRFIERVTANLPQLSRTAPRAEHLVTAERGEDAAFFYLRRQGYTVVARRFRSHRAHGDIDIVAWDGETLCFIEVKTRTTHDVKPAEVSVDCDKQRSISKVAREYLRKLPELPAYRFDIVSIYCDNQEKQPNITLFQNAFPMA